METNVKNYDFSEHRGLKLKKIKEHDLEKIMHWRMLPEVTEYMYTDPELNMDMQKKWFEKISNDNTCKYWTITVDDVAIGVIGITDIDLNNLRCNWNWYIGELDYRGKGIAHQVQCNICDYVFDKLKLNRLYSEVLVKNSHNINVHENCGYLIEGILKEHIVKHNKFYDVAVFGIIKSKWYSIKEDIVYDKIYIEE